MPAPFGPEAVLRPAAREIIRIKARKLSRRPGFRRDEVEDLEQQIRIAVIEKLPTFDANRCNIDGFINVVADSAAGMIARARRAEKRGVYRSHRSLDLGTEAQHGDTLGAKLTPSDGARRLGIAPPMQIDRVGLKAVIDSMPEELASICRLLGTHTIADIARTLGMRRQRVHEVMPRIRQHFADARFEVPDEFD